MVDFLTTADLQSRVQSLTQTGAVNYGQWTPARKLELLNEAQLEVHKQLCEAWEEMFFCEVSGNLTPVNNQINLDTLGKPYYRRLAFQQLHGSEWRKVDVLTMADASVAPRRFPEVWYQTGTVLRSDTLASLTGTYRVIYNYRIPDLVNDATPCEIPREYVEMVPLYAAARAYLQSNVPDLYAARLGEYARLVQDMQKTASNRSADRRRRVVDVLGLRRGRNYLVYGNNIV